MTKNETNEYMTDIVACKLQRFTLSVCRTASCYHVSKTISQCTQKPTGLRYSGARDNLPREISRCQKNAEGKGLGAQVNWMQVLIAPN